MVEDLVVGTGGPIIRPSVRGFKLLVTGGNEVIWVQHRETNKLVIWLDYDVKPPLGRTQLDHDLKLIYGEIWVETIYTGVEDIIIEGLKKDHFSLKKGN